MYQWTNLENLRRMNSYHLYNSKNINIIHLVLIIKENKIQIDDFKNETDNIHPKYEAKNWGFICLKQDPLYYQGLRPVSMTQLSPHAGMKVCYKVITFVLFPWRRVPRVCSTIFVIMRDIINATSEDQSQIMPGPTLSGSPRVVTQRVVQTVVMETGL